MTFSEKQRARPMYQRGDNMFERQVTCLVPGRSMETYHGQVRTPADAIILFEACRIGLLPRVQRRLSEKERSSISSGSVFVWDEREAGMRRWTDGKSWSASRVSGSFLTYREMEGKRGGGGTNTPGTNAPGFPGSSRAASPASSTTGKPSKRKEQSPDDSPDGYRYKADGLMKQSFSISTSAGQHLHLISYFARQETHESRNLPCPSTDPRLRMIRPEKGMYPEASLQDHNLIPALTRGPMGSPYPPSSSSSRVSPRQTNDSPYVSSSRYASSFQYQQEKAYKSSPYASWRPPSPSNTPSRSPRQTDFRQDRLASLNPVQYNRPGPTAFDRPPAPLSNPSLPLVDSRASQSHPYYTTSQRDPRDARDRDARDTYPPPPQPLRHERSLSYEKLSQSQADRHDSAYTRGPGPDVRPDARDPRDLRDLRDPLSTLTPTQPRTSTPPGTKGQTIPSISTLIENISQSPPNRERPALPTHRSANAVPTRNLVELPSLSSGLLNHDTRALRDLDKVTFRA